MLLVKANEVEGKLKEQYQNIVFDMVTENNQLKKAINAGNEKLQNLHAKQCNELRLAFGFIDTVVSAIVDRDTLEAWQAEVENKYRE